LNVPGSFKTYLAKDETVLVLLWIPKPFLFYEKNKRLRELLNYRRW